MDTKEQFMLNFRDVDFSFDSEASLSVRNAALQVLENMDFPTTKTEYWKYTRVAPLVKKNYRVASSAVKVDITNHRYADHLLVFVNGFYRTDLSSASALTGLHVCSLSEAKERFPAELSNYFGELTAHSDDIFTQLNSAYHNDGVFIKVDKGVQIEEPIQLLHYTDGNEIVAMPRNLVVAEEGSKVQLVESYEELNGEAAFVNSVSEFFVERHAQIEYNKVQNGGQTNNYIAKEEVHQQEGSHFKINTYTLSGKLVRNNLNIAVTEQHCQTELNGIYLTKGKQHVDNHTIVDHQQPHCESRELYKGVLNERSTAVFNGRVLVRRAAQKTNAFQSNANLLLTDDATINSKPELEIYADDVKCSHGSTTGQLDDDALFYLKARGIDEEKARNMLLYAFAAEVLEQSGIPLLRDHIDHYIAQRYHNKF